MQLHCLIMQTKGNIWGRIRTKKFLVTRCFSQFFLWFSRKQYYIYLKRIVSLMTASSSTFLSLVQTFVIVFCCQVVFFNGKPLKRRALFWNCLFCCYHKELFREILYGLSMSFAFTFCSFDGVFEKKLIIKRALI